MDAPDIDPALCERRAVDALLHYAQTRGDAVEHFRTAMGQPEMPVTEVNAAFWSALDRHGWAILLAPELWAAFLEWQSCQRFEADIERHRRVLSTAEDAVNCAVVSPFLLDAQGGQIGDIIPARTAAYAKVAAEVTRAEAEYARARARFVKCCYAVLRRKTLTDEWPKDDRARVMLRRQAWLEGEIATVHALMGTPAPQDEGGVTSIMQSLAKRLPALSPRG